MQIDENVFDVQVPGSSLERIALFSRATEDPNPIHVDQAFAQASGFPQVIQQGPMTTAHLARLLADRFGPRRVAWLDVNFVAPVFPQESLRMQARVTRIAGELVQVGLTVTKSDGTVTARGEAQIGNSR